VPRGRQLVFEVAPESFDRIEFGTIGGQKDRYHIGRPVHGFGLVPGPVVEPQHVQRLWKGSGKAVQPPLERMSVKVRQFEKETRSGGRLHSAIQIEILKLVGHRGERLPPAEPPRSTRWSPFSGPIGSMTASVRYASYQFQHHPQTFPLISWSPQGFGAFSSTG